MVRFVPVWGKRDRLILDRLFIAYDYVAKGQSWAPLTKHANKFLFFSLQIVEESC